MKQANQRSVNTRVYHGYRDPLGTSRNPDERGKGKFGVSSRQNCQNLIKQYQQGSDRPCYRYRFEPQSKSTNGEKVLPVTQRHINL